MSTTRFRLWFFAFAILSIRASAQEEGRLRSGDLRGSLPALEESAPLYVPPGRYRITADHLGRLNFDPALASAFQRALDSVRAVQGTRGMSAAVLVPGQGLWLGVSGVSSLNPAVAVDPSMLFGIGSNTKAFVSATVLSLVDSGKISLDAPLSQYLPPLPNITGTVTIRQLLNMTSGLFDYLNDSNAQGDSVAANPTRYWTPGELITTFVGPPRTSPGGAYRYCNTNYVLLGMVISSVTGHPVSAEIRKRILTPLSLDHTYLEVEEPYMDPVAHPWDSGIDFMAIPVTAHFTTLWTAGGIMSTAENMARWVKSLYEGAVISESSLAEMLKVVPMSSNAAPGLDWSGYGLGVRQGGYFGRRLLGHGGAIMGYISHTGYFPGRGASFVILTNMSEASATRAMTALMDVYIRTMPAGPASPGTWYALSGKTDSTRLYSLDPATGVLTAIGPTQCGTIVGARIEPRTGTFWALTGTTGWEMAHIDGATGEAFLRKRVTFPAGASSDLKGMDFAPDGSLYVGSADGRIYSINLATGAATLAITTRIPISGLAFEPSTGALWVTPRTSAVFRDRIYKVSNSTGDTLGVGNTGFTQILADIAFDSGGELYALVGNPSTPINYRWARIDRSTGSGTEIASMRFSGMVGIACAPAATGIGTGPRAERDGPARIELLQNYPNPFNHSSEITFELPEVSRVTLTVHDLLGREVAVLVDDTRGPGTYQVTFDASRLATGVYLSRLAAGSAVLTRPMVLVR